MKTKGFTLVELLVVIAILAILATVSVVGYTSYIGTTNQNTTLTEGVDIHNAIRDGVILGTYAQFKDSDDTVVYAQLDGASFKFIDELPDGVTANDISALLTNFKAKLSYADGVLTYTNRGYKVTINGTTPAAATKAE